MLNWGFQKYFLIILDIFSYILQFGSFEMLGFWIIILATFIFVAGRNIKFLNI